MSDSEVGFCPLCQLPLSHLKITSSAHISDCSVVWDDLPDCPDGRFCLSTNTFHFRDYNHSVLAAYRSSSSSYLSNLSIKNLESGFNEFSSSISHSPKIIKRKHNVKNPPELKKVCKSEKKNLCSDKLSGENLSDDDDECLIFKKSKRRKRSLGLGSEDNAMCKKLNNNKNEIVPLTSSDSSPNARTCIISSSNSEKFNDQTGGKNKILLNCNKFVENKGKIISQDMFDSLSDENKFFPTEKIQEENEINKNVYCGNEYDNLENGSKSFGSCIIEFDDGSNSERSKEQQKCFELNSPLTKKKSNIKLFERDEFYLSETNSVLMKDENKDNELFFKAANSVANDLMCRPITKYVAENCAFSSSNITSFKNSTGAESLGDKKSVCGSNREEDGFISDKALETEFFKQKYTKRQRNSIKRKCPFFKLIPDTEIAVDAFNYGYIPGVKSYFLTHFHSDHYIGLTKSFSMPIFCSSITANLIKLMIRVDDKWLNVINVGDRRVVNGTEVVALEANHCPGSLMFLFQLRTGQNILHVGDFRFSPKMELYPELRSLHINKLFLDTTYCKPEYDFPIQENVIREVLKLVKDVLNRNSLSLIVFGTYLIGKEKVFSAVAEACNFGIWTEPRKKKIFHCVGDPCIVNRLANKPSHRQIHVLSMHNITFEKLEEYLNKFNSIYNNVVAFRPTGWSTKTSLLKFSPRVKNRISIYDVPYSEHSSFSELRRFVQFMRPDEIIPTVNIGSPSSRKEMKNYFQSWLSETKFIKQTSLLDFLSHKTV